MDVLTQGLLGGLLAQSVAKRQQKPIATLVGFAAGLLADADILIRSADDSLLTLEYHRHFTHSLFFIPFGAAIAFVLLWPFLRSRLPVTRLYGFCLAGYSMSGILDACTSYGTVLFWPLSDTRVAWNLIAIVDPLFTLILLVTLLWGLRLPAKPLALIGLSLAGLYLVFGGVQQHRAQLMAQALQQQRGHVAEKAVVKPTLGNLVLWRSVYIYQQRIYVDAVRVGLFADNRVYEGESVPKFELTAAFPELSPASQLHKDIQRFTTFSDGFVALDATQSQVLGDIRYSLLPVSAKPLWGIAINPQAPQQGAQYQFFRKNNPQLRQQFLAMVWGR